MAHRGAVAARVKVGLGPRRVLEQSGHRGPEQGQTGADQPPGQGARGVAGIDGDLGLGEDRPRIDFRNGPMEADAGHLRPVGDDPIDRLRSPVVGQPRGVDVDEAVMGDAQGRSVDDLIEAGHDRRLRAQRRQVDAAVVVIDPPGAEQGDAQVIGDPAQRVVPEDGRMGAGGGDDPADVDVQLEQTKEECQRVVGGEADEEDPGPGAGLGVSRRCPGEVAVGGEAEAGPRQQFLADRVEVGRDRRHSPILASHVASSPSRRRPASASTTAPGRAAAGTPATAASSSATLWSGRASMARRTAPRSCRMLPG